MYWLSRKIEPNIPRNIRRLAALIPEKARERNSRMGSIGFLLRTPWCTKPASSALPAIRPVRTREPVQPSTGPRTSPYTMPKSPPLTSRVPGRSSRAPAP